MPWMKLFAIFAWLALFAVRTDAAFRLASVFSDGMVLHKGPEMANIWGFADTAGATVEATLDGAAVASATTTSGQGGATWMIQLPAHDEGGPFTIEITSDAGTLTLNDVWFGDVWFCSGQSNMEYSLEDMDNTDELVQNAVPYTNVHMMHVERKVQENTVAEVEIHSSWQLAGDDVGTKDFSILCLLYGMELSKHFPDRPIGMLQTSWWGTPVESWSSPDALGMCPPNNNDYGTYDHYRQKVLWYGMIEPLAQMTMTGAIWYQGESNAGHADEYKCSFAAMISDWRTKFHAASGEQTSELFPFGFVQLAGYRDEERRDGFPDLRWTETYEYGYVPNPDLQQVFMAVAMDLPDFDSPHGPIHPRHKQPIAERLALGGRAVAYGETDVEFQGPFPSTITLDGSTLSVEYDDGNTVIDVRSNDGFQVCCSSFGGCNTNSWTSVPITDSDQTSVYIDVSACSGADISALRYAWEETPCDYELCPVYSQSSDLPSPPYVIDGPF